MVPDILWKRVDNVTNDTIEDFSFVNLDAMMEFKLYQKDSNKDTEFNSEFYTSLINWT